MTTPDRADEHAGDRVAVRDVIRPDTRSLRALAHPLRLELLGLLRLGGPATATTLAERTGQSTGSTSYHLRQLEAAGLIVEDAGRGNARDRWWRAAHRSTHYDPVATDEESRAVGEQYLRVVADWSARRVQQAVTALSTMDADLGPGWTDAMTMSDYGMRLTVDEAKALIADLEALAARYRRNDPDRLAEAPDGSELVFLQFQVLPGTSRDRS